MSSARVLRISPNRKTGASPMRALGVVAEWASVTQQPSILDKADVAGSRAQLDAALAKTPNVTPTLVVIFGGVFDPRSLRFPFNRLPASDARDWDAIRQFAEQAGSLFAHNAQVVPI